MRIATEYTGREAKLLRGDRGDVTAGKKKKKKKKEKETRP